MGLPFHRESAGWAKAPSDQVFERLDDPLRLAAHMGKSSAMMLGSKMDMTVDEAGGRAVGSHIGMTGRILGIPVFLDEVVSERLPPRRKTWHTVGPLRLLVLDAYAMGFEVSPEGPGSRLRVFIDYRLPDRGLDRWLGRALGHWYARWCVERMLQDAIRHFNRPAPANVDGHPRARQPSLSPWRQVVAFHFAVVFAVLGLLSLFFPGPAWAAAFAVLAMLAWWTARRWNRQAPLPMPYYMRWILLLPRGPNAPKNLNHILAPRPGERILEVGPGVGVHALPLAEALAPSGVLDVLDLQKEMLDGLKNRKMIAGITNIREAQGDAQKLPYRDRTFDAAYMIGTLGEIPDEAAALGELRRVLKPGGRAVVGEILVDPDFVTLSDLKEKARGSGLDFELETGPRFAYFARFRPCP